MRSIILEAAKSLTEDDFYPEFDEETGLYCVFGTESGFAYNAYSSMKEAEKEASRMQAEKEASKLKESMAELEAKGHWDSGLSESREPSKRKQAQEPDVTA